MGEKIEERIQEEFIMKVFSLILLITALTVPAAHVEAKPVEEYIHEADGHLQSGYLAEAVSTMTQALQEHPGSLEAHSYLGLYLGMQAGQTEDMTAAMELVNRSFEMLDRAVEMDDRNLLARFHRGLMGISVPEFFGRLDQSIADLEFFIDEHQKSPQAAPRDQLVKAYDLLAQGYRTRGDLKQARGAYEQVIDLAPGSELAASAEAGIDDLSDRMNPKTAAQSIETEPNAGIQELQEKIAGNPDDPSLHIQLGYVYLQDAQYDPAREAFQAALALDETSRAAHRGLISTIMEEASRGYDRRIYDNTHLRTNLAFEMVRALDRAVAALPKDPELRLWRGMADVQMPFFVQKLDQGIADLEMIINGQASDSLQAEALYWLGRGYQKKATAAWIRVVKEHAGAPAAEMVFDQMHPDIWRPNISDLRKPLVTIDFVLGFRDELAPQTAVWIEETDGRFVKTIYVSGFAGYIRERQITLPVWGAVSEFADADAVTGASIDVGHHIFTWDLSDRDGNTVAPGSYTVKVEVSHWPSNLYQLAQADIDIGKKQSRTVAEEGHFIPYLEINYHPQ